MKCFHHDDIDGRAAGAVVAKFENNYQPENFFEVDYVQVLPLDKINRNERVYFVDYSFSKNTVDVLRRILEITPDVIWIDHHKSSEDMLKEYPEFKTIPGIVKEGISGAALAYMYLYHKSYEEIPKILQYVSDYDCFHLKLPDTMQFKYGVESVDHGPLSDLWVRALDVNYGILEELIRRGEIVKSYHNNQCKDVRNTYGYESTVEGYTALIINRDGNSSLFGDQFNQYDVCIRWTFNGERYVYSIFTSKDDIDVSKIAEKFGGGGHKRAAGFSSVELLFKKS